MQGIRTFRLVADGLETISLPSLQRPPVKPSEPASEELVLWGVKFYAFSVTAHMQQILAGLLQIAEGGNIPTAWIISRHVFEWAAHACYVSQRVLASTHRKDWQAAWETLTVAATGNLWMSRYGAKYSGGNAVKLPNPIPKPLHISALMAEYEQYDASTTGRREVKDDYGLLSEHSHPNAACLTFYHQYEPNGIVRFAPPQPTSPLPIVNWCLIDLLRFIEELLAAANESTVRREVVGVLKELAKRAPAVRL
jgi:hypothetical protein